MELNLSAEQIRDIKVKFEMWQEVQSRKKELQEENKQICKDAAEIFDGKMTDASKLFRNMQMLYDGEDAEANEISLILDRITGKLASGEEAEE